MKNIPNKNKSLIPKVSIGIPVYNGEESIRQAIDSVLTQTFSDFELIISDNDSTDSTSKICREYEKKDKRIRYIKQEKNKGWFYNFKFVLDLASCEYFVWLSDDDYWESTFLEENVKILDSKLDVVGSIGIVKYLTELNDNKTSVQKFKDRFRDKNTDFKSYRHVAAVNGSYFKKAQFYLRFNQASFIYAVFRTKKLRKRWNLKLTAPWDLTLLLNILKEGDFNVIEKILMYRPSSGVRSSVSRVKLHQQKMISTIDLFIPSFSFAFWCAKNIGKKFFIKNLDWFLMLTLYGWYAVIRR